MWLYHSTQIEQAAKHARFLLPPPSSLAWLMAFFPVLFYSLSSFFFFFSFFFLHFPSPSPSLSSSLTLHFL